MSAPIIVNLALTEEAVDAIARRVAALVVDDVVRALRSAGPPAAAGPTSTAQSDVRPTGRTGAGDITDGQLRVLKGWRNVAQLEAVLAIVVGDRDVAIETLTKVEASAVLDELTPADRRRSYTPRGARRDR